MKTNRSRVAVLAALVAPWALAPAQQRESFVTTLGKDTLSLEQLDRTQDSVVGDWVTTYGGITVHHYAIHLRRDGSVDRCQLTMHRLSGHVDGTFDLQFVGDSLVAKFSGGSEQRVAVKDAIPVACYTIGAHDLVMAHARASGGDSSVVPIVWAFGPYRRGAMPIVFAGGDSARMGNRGRRIG